MQFDDKYLTHPTKSPKLHLSLSLHRSFTRNWKHCFLTNPILNPTLLPAYLSVSTPNTIHLSRLPVCLPDSLDFDPLPIDFVFIERLWISWFPRLRFCGRCRSYEFTITITITLKRPLSVPSEWENTSSEQRKHACQKLTPRWTERTMEAS